MLGTKFIVSVEYTVSQEGGEAVERMKSSAVVTAMVASGVVAYHFGDLTEVLDGGSSKVFAGEQAAVGLPDGMKGFIGMLQGKIVEKTNDGFVLQVEKVEKTWRNNKAENPAASVGKNVQFRVLDRHRAIVRVFAKLKVGDGVVAGGIHKEGNCLLAVEVLAKAEEYPALKAKWEEAARKRKQRDAPRREKAAALRSDALGGFCGMLRGKIVEKGENGFALQIEKVEKTWERHNKAKSPAASVGKTVSLRLHPKGKHVREQLGKMKVGDSVVTGAMNREGKVLMVVELLVKAEEYPALQAKWDRQRKEREARRRKDRERKEGKRDGADR